MSDPVAGIWEDFIDIFYAPASVFARRQTGSFWIPLFTVTILLGTLFFLNSGAMQPIMDAEFNRGMAVAMRNNPQMNAEAVERFRQIGTRIAQVFVFVFTPVVIGTIGVCLWLIGKLFEAKQTLKAALVVSAYAYVPRVVEAVLNGVQALVLDPAGLNGRFRLSLGPGRFIDPDTASPILLAIVGRMDLFTIWITILLAIGLSVTGGIPRGRSAIAAALIWAIGAIPLIVQAIRSM
ncbi:MAG: YIP1 family protein [Vicinamibacterales bacterium]|nr:YIP1 family protein [Vicinamibacterales bacterium]